MIRRDVPTLISIFCDADDFCKEFEPVWRKILIENNDEQLIGDKKQRNRKTELSLSEAMTIVIMFHKTRHRTFKDYYERYVLAFLKPYFPKLLSYSRFVNLMKTCLFPLFIFSQGCLAGVYRNAFENDRFSLGNFEISLYYPFSTSAMSKSSASFFCRGVIRFNVNSV